MPYLPSLLRSHQRKKRSQLPLTEEDETICVNHIYPKNEGALSPLFLFSPFFFRLSSGHLTKSSRHFTVAIAVTQIHPVYIFNTIACLTPPLPPSPSLVSFICFYDTSHFLSIRFDREFIYSIYICTYMTTTCDDISCKCSKYQIYVLYCAIPMRCDATYYILPLCGLSPGRSSGIGTVVHVIGPRHCKPATHELFRVSLCSITLK